jgi:hypothetical protein
MSNILQFCIYEIPISYREKDRWTILTKEHITFCENGQVETGRAN